MYNRLHFNCQTTGHKRNEAMDFSNFKQRTEFSWEIPQAGNMLFSAVIYGSRQLIADMDEKVLEQVSNVAGLPGIVKTSYAIPDAHWGYDFPIGGVAAFDPDKGGVISAGGVGFDISCGVRLVHTGLTDDDIIPVQQQLADILYHHSGGCRQYRKTTVECGSHKRHAHRRRQVGAG